MGITFTVGTAEFAIASVHSTAEHSEFRALILQPRCTLGAVIAEMHRREQHPLTGFEAGHVLAEFDYLARDVAAQNVRQFDAGQALTYPEVEVVHCASLDADQNLILARLRIRNIFVAQNLGTTEFMEANGFHEQPSRTKLSQEAVSAWADVLRSLGFARDFGSRLPPRSRLLGVSSSNLSGAPCFVKLPALRFAIGRATRVTSGKRVRNIDLPCRQT